MKQTVYGQENMSIMDKLAILSDAAKYDVACTSSGVARKGTSATMGNTIAGGICHCFAADGRCISLLKILFTNECIFDCKYCVNRSSNDVVRTSFTAKEVARLVIQFYRRNYIEGLFLSSGIYKSPDYTMEQLYETLRILREEYQFNGYIHVKAIPGADPLLIERTGYLADRMSINLELPTADGLKALAPNKKRTAILKPMRQIQIKREDNQYRIGMKGELVPRNQRNELMAYKKNKTFVPAGQSSQMIVGATNESDYEIIKVAEALYKNFDLKRVFYSAFVNTTFDTHLPVLQDGPPLLREHRLYQADWLLRFYGFEASELLSEQKPNFNILLDPKCNWALNHLEQFPVEVTKASYKTLLRVPGIGVKSAQRILLARKSCLLDFSDLKKMGVVLKRALYFITCNGRMMYPVKLEPDFIINHMLDLKEQLPNGIGGTGVYQQISLFDDTDTRWRLSV
ncbi:putative DNA modification/repair radical SAM protein [Velocimicrobium porci]|uniref:Putative DNA modification/repair radical SAM protein n=1 Tax=Velocimicrobium porci TaxID=2606634 RepID=A0A6L5Y082_9FIRM|nr:putative DNA modification/repair radical SAM protein [Velocimicrobium porci]MSS64279.1 putative DNA modification/repair radical SAM protein [Velocimicrobium porci]